MPKSILRSGGENVCAHEGLRWPAFPHLFVASRGFESSSCPISRPAACSKRQPALLRLRRPSVVAAPSLDHHSSVDTQREGVVGHRTVESLDDHRRPRLLRSGKRDGNDMEITIQGLGLRV